MTWDDLEHDAHAKRTFEKNGRDPRLWVAFADDLHHAADVLWEATSPIAPVKGEPPSLEKIAWLMSVGKIAMMLDGFAVEMLAKAVMVRRDPDAVKDGRWRGRRKGHPLPALLEEIGFPLSPDETALVAHLAAFAAWAGRYPIPLEYTATTAKVTDGKIELAPGTLLSTDDRQAAADLIARLRRLAAAA